MKNHVLVFAAFAASTSLAAVPNVDQNAVTLAQDSQSRLVTVGYTLTGEPAVITVDFQTNAVANAETGWTSIGEANFTNTTGFVNQVVPTGAHSLYWQPQKAWPDQVIGAGKFRAVVKAWATNAPPDYCAVCLLTDAQMEDKKTADVAWNIPRRRYFVSAAAVPGGVQDAMYKTQFLLLRKIPAAGVVWRMGQARSTDASVYPHKVMLTQDYYIGVYEMTVGQHSTIGGTPGTSRYPQGGVKWSDLRGTYASYPWPEVGEGYTNYTHNVASTSLLGKLRTRSGIDSFDLPTEAQWEFACRSGHGGWVYNNDSTSTDAGVVGGSLLKIAWCANNWSSGGTYNSSSRLHVVGEKDPNDWGLYDMLGNAQERALDWYANYGAPPSSDYIAVDPKGPATGSNKVFRGGYVWQDSNSGWTINMPKRGSGTADYYDTCYGYRVVCDAVAK